MVRRLPLQFAKLNLTWSLWPLINTRQRMRNAFFSANMPENRLNEYFLRMQDETFLGFLDMLVFRLPSPKKVKTPIIIIVVQNDYLFSPKEMESTAKAYGTKAVFFDDMAHDMMLEENWKAVADYILPKLSGLSSRLGIVKK